MTCQFILFSIIRNVVCGEPLSQSVQDACTPEVLESLYSLAKKHDLAHLIACGLEKFDKPDSEIISKFQDAKKRAVMRYLRSEYELNRIGHVLENNRIQHIPLKGAVLREYYPEQWMRTSGDLDILVHENEVEQASGVLETTLRYTRIKKGDHDISLRSSSGLLIELHYLAIDEGRFPHAQRILSRIWDDSIATSGFRRNLPDELFYFYHIAHMAKHIENGGCGIRPFLDLWILNHKMHFDVQNRRKLLEGGMLVPFAEAAEKLSEVWFSQMKMDPLSQHFEDYVLRGGTHGILENQIGVYQTKLGSKIRYALQKIFLPYDTLKYHYPILQKHKFLTPIFEVIRWLKLLFKGGIKRSAREMQMNVSMTGERMTEIQQLLLYLGLESKDR